MNNQDTDDKGAVVVRNYWLNEPLDWDSDITDELWKANRFWNTLVEIENQNRTAYREIINQSDALKAISDQISDLESQRDELLAERSKLRARARSKTKADTAEIDKKLRQIKSELKPLFAQSKELRAKAREEQKPHLKKLDEERFNKIKNARQNSNIFWSNYNAVEKSYNTARFKAIKENAQLHFRRFSGEGRLVNQIQGGITVEELFSGKHSQVSIALAATDNKNKAKTTNIIDKRQYGTLTITAYTGRESVTNKPFRRNVSFPIVLHRPFPEDAIIKEVSVSIRKRPETKRGIFDEQKIQSRFEYSVTFTCRSKNLEVAPSGQSAAGVNLGWKTVPAGLRAATVRYSNGDVDHLILDQKWLSQMQYVRELQELLDKAANEMLPKILIAISDLPPYSDDITLDGIPTYLHRKLSSIKRAKRPNVRTFIDLFLQLKMQWDREPNSVQLLHSMASDIEKWRKKHKRKLLEMRNLNKQLLSRRENMYRVFAKQLCDKAGAILIDATSYKEAAIKMDKSGEENPLFQAARANRVLVSPYLLRLSIEQAATARNANVERIKSPINHCHHCGSNNIRGNVDELYRSCGDCQAVFDVDVNATINLLNYLNDSGKEEVGCGGA